MLGDKLAKYPVPMSYAVTSSVGLSLAMSGKCSWKQLSANRTFLSRCYICACVFLSLRQTNSC